MNATKNECIEPMLAISTGHLTPDARTWLDTNADLNEASARDSSILRYGQIGTLGRTVFGWFMHAPERRTDETMPAELWHVCETARAAKCAYILFDADAPYLSGLPAFDDDGSLIDDEAASLTSAHALTEETRGEFLPDAALLGDDPMAVLLMKELAGLRGDVMAIKAAMEARPEIVAAPGTVADKLRLLRTPLRVTPEVKDNYTRAEVAVILAQNDQLRKLAKVGRDLIERDLTEHTYDPGEAIPHRGYIAAVDALLAAETEGVTLPDPNVELLRIGGMMANAAWNLSQLHHSHPASLADWPRTKESLRELSDQWDAAVKAARRS